MYFIIKLANIIGRVGEKYRRERTFLKKLFILKKGGCKGTILRHRCSTYISQNSISTVMNLQQQLPRVCIFFLMSPSSYFCVAFRKSLISKLHLRTGMKTVKFFCFEMSPLPLQVSKHSKKNFTGFCIALKRHENQLGD